MTGTRTLNPGSWLIPPDTENPYSIELSGHTVPDRYRLRSGLPARSVRKLLDGPGGDLATRAPHERIKGLTAESSNSKSR